MNRVSLVQLQNPTCLTFDIKGEIKMIYSVSIDSGKLMSKLNYNTTISYMIYYLGVSMKQHNNKKHNITKNGVISFFVLFEKAAKVDCILFVPHNVDFQFS